MRQRQTEKLTESSKLLAGERPPPAGSVVDNAVLCGSGDRHGKRHRVVAYCHRGLRPPPYLPVAGRH